MAVGLVMPCTPTKEFATVFGNSEILMPISFANLGDIADMVDVSWICVSTRATAAVSCMRTFKRHVKGLFSGSTCVTFNAVNRPCGVEWGVYGLLSVVVIDVFVWCRAAFVCLVGPVGSVVASGQLKNPAGLRWLWCGWVFVGVLDPGRS